MEVDELTRALEPWLAKHRRPAWKPVTEPGDGTRAESKFGGTPWTGPAAPWPACAECGEPMPLFVQLDLAALPPELAGAAGPGLFQLFYCTNDCDGGYEAFGGPQCARVVQPDGEPAVAELPTGSFAPKCIMNWTRFSDVPSAEEQDELGLTRDYSGGSSVSVGCAELDFAADVSEDVVESIAPAPGDKLGGWPYWVQGAEYPACPECGAQMRLLFQLDSQDNLPFMFGDVGCGHVTQCPVHTDIVAFGWACS